MVSGWGDGGCDRGVGREVGRVGEMRAKFDMSGKKDLQNIGHGCDG